MMSGTFLNTVIRYTSRLICLGALAWFGLIVADATGSLKDMYQFSHIVEAKFNSEPDIPQLISPTAGYWSFTDSDLAVQKSTCSQDELRQQMERLIAIDVNTKSLNHDASHLVALAKSNGAIGSDCQAGLAWSFQNHELQLLLITTDSDSPRLIAAACASKNGERWELTTLKPERHVDDHLLPLPTDAKICCNRRSNTGLLQMELVSTSRTAEQLLDLWQRSGWTVQHTPWGPADSFSYLCARDEEVIYAWTDSTTGSRSIMLTNATPEQENKQ